MQVTAIIAEWNPLHRGHLLPVQAARQQGATHIVAILSGNFVQRGEPALCPWQYRAAAALSSGVDLVLQLPLPYAVSTLQRFGHEGKRMTAALFYRMKGCNKESPAAHGECEAKVTGQRRFCVVSCAFSCF